MKIKNKFIKYIIVFLFCIISMNFISIKSEKAFNLIGFRAYTILSGSMKPKIDPGDIVIILNKNKVNLNKNDIITFKEDNTVITHRIVDIKDEGYITKGDNNNSIDAYTVTPKNILGKVMFRIPKLGYILEFLSRPLIIALEMIIAAVLIIKENKD